MQKNIGVKIFVKKNALFFFQQRIKIFINFVGRFCISSRPKWAYQSNNTYIVETIKTRKKILLNRWLPLHENGQADDTESIVNCTD